LPAGSIRVAFLNGRALKIDPPSIVTVGLNLNDALFRLVQAERRRTVAVKKIISKNKVFSDKRVDTEIHIRRNAKGFIR